PMHPAYGAGHAAVAGACVTVMKTFFQLVRGHKPGRGYVTLRDAKIAPKGTTEELTLTGELDKLAANISIGRSMAGVHYGSDYFDSLRMGERVAVGMVLEQLTTYGEPISIVLESFDGDRIVLSSEADGDAFPRRPCAKILDRYGNPVGFTAWWQRHAPRFESLMVAEEDAHVA
ncbi:MAG: hypothetical protein ACU0CO_02775, partial [Shimia sp.]